MKATIDDRRQDSDEKMKTYDSKPDKLVSMIKNMMNKNQDWNSSPESMDPPSAQDTTTVVLSNKKAPTL